MWILLDKLRPTDCPADLLIHGKTPHISQERTEEEQLKFRRLGQSMSRRCEEVLNPENPDKTINKANVPIITPIVAIMVIILMVLLLLFENK